MYQHGSYTLYWNVGRQKATFPIPFTCLDIAINHIGCNFDQIDKRHIVEKIIMQTKHLSKFILPLFIMFIVLDASILYWHSYFTSTDVDLMAIFICNCLLFVLSVLSLAMHGKAIEQKNANAMVTSVMGATLLKLFVLAIAAFVYLFMKKSANVTYTLFISMFMYIVYTALEVRTALKMNQKNDGKH